MKNNVIEFKKDCIMKTMVSEITDISLTHDYKILDDMIEGYFDVSGEYKVTVSSMQKEEFMYTIPFSIALSSLIDKSSINLTIKDFNYTTEKDMLHLKMALNMDYSEITLEEEKLETTLESTLEENNEEDEMDTIDEILESMPEVEENVFHNELMNEIEKEEITINKTEINTTEEINLEDKKEAQESIQTIISNMNETDSFYKYKIYIMRSEDTIESIAIKYNISLDDLKEYNNIENINIGDKIVIPFINNAEE